jgi:hypothetical protein
MNPNKIWESVSRTYDTVQIALWALALSGMTCLLVFGAPMLPGYWAQAAAVRTLEIATENNSYCKKLGMPAGSPKYEQCLLTLGEFRLKVEKRIATEQDF